MFLVLQVEELMYVVGVAASQDHPIPASSGVASLI